MRIEVLAILMLVLAAPALRAEEDEGLKLLRQGLQRLQRGDYEGALASFRDAQIERPESPEIHFNVGMALYRLERFDEARTAFTAAARGASVELEKKALFHVANCYVKEGKLQEALDAYNRAIGLDEDFALAKQNREWVVRKLKELARKQKEQQEKAREERRIIEKLQEIIQQQVELHAGLRYTMAGLGRAFGPTRIAELREILAAEPPREFMTALRKELPEGASEEDETRFLAGMLERTEPVQKALHEKLQALLAEAGEKIAGAADAGAQPGMPPGGDPEIAKLEKAVPELEAAEAAMTRALRAAGEEQDPIGLHAGQEGALEALLRALNLLLNELDRLIKDQAMLLRKGYELARLLEDEAPEKRPDEAALRDAGVEDAQTQRGHRDRCEALAQGVEQQLEQARQQAAQAQAPGGSGVQPGQDPEEATRRLETALGHLNEASGAMELAEAELVKPELQAALESERRALEELVKARAALQPPQQGGQQKSDQQQKNQDQEKGEQEPQQPEDQDKKGEQGQESPSDPAQGQQAQEEGAEPQEMSEEQAKKTLERMRQRELERRKDEQDEQKRAARGGRRRVEKDW